MELKEVLFLIIGSSAFTAFLSTILNYRLNKAKINKDNADAELKQEETNDILINRYRTELNNLENKVTGLENKLILMEKELIVLREKGTYWEKSYNEIKGNFESIVKIYRGNKCEKKNCKVEKVAKLIVEQHENKFGKIV